MQKIKQLLQHPNFFLILIGLHVLLPLLGILIESVGGGDASIFLLILFILLLLLVDFILIFRYVIARAKAMFKGE